MLLDRAVLNEKEKGKMTQENKQAEPIKEYYIAYFDLLGYKEFFHSYPDKVGDFLQVIHDAISNIKDYIQGIKSSFIGGEFGRLSIRTRVFSDNILLCLETSDTQIEYPRFLAFLTIIADIQRNFILKYGLFLRGSVTIGKLSFNDDFIFGQGLIDAVELEKVAIYPRIILGKAALDYVLQPHFVGQDDLNRACDIEKRAHCGEHISDEELAFCNSIMPAVNMEKFYLQWRMQLLFPISDGIVSLNYLYCLNINNLFDQSTIKQILDLLKIFLPNDYQKLSSSSHNQIQLLEQHKDHVSQKIREYGQYNDLDVSSPDGIKEASIREHILKKYLWVLMFHNYICTVYNTLECRIKSGSTCDIRFLRMTAEIFEDSSFETKS